MRVPKAEVASRAAKAEAQRNRILDAAQKCFAQQGFHGATMSTIAETAGISAGLAYRYFPGKDAIVLAIIERQLELRRGRIEALPFATDLAGRLVEMFGEMRDRKGEEAERSLFLEMSAEATRNPAIGAAMAKADQLTRELLQAWFERRAGRSGKEPDPTCARSQALLLQLVAEGVIVLSTREPGFDPAVLADAMRRFVDGVGMGAMAPTDQ